MKVVFWVKTVFVAYFVKHSGVAFLQMDETGLFILMICFIS